MPLKLSLRGIHSFRCLPSRVINSWMETRVQIQALLIINCKTEFTTATLARSVISEQVISSCSGQSSYQCLRLTQSRFLNCWASSFDWGWSAVLLGDWWCSWKLVGGLLLAGSVCFWGVKHKSLAILLPILHKSGPFPQLWFDCFEWLGSGWHIKYKQMWMTGKRITRVGASFKTPTKKMTLNAT